MSLLEQEAVRMASALDDYEHLRVSEIGGTEEAGYWLLVTDERLGLRYEIASHCDHWDFIGYFASGQQWPARPLPRGEVAFRRGRAEETRRRNQFRY